MEWRKGIKKDGDQNDIKISQSNHNAPVRNDLSQFLWHIVTPQMCQRKRMLCIEEQHKK